MKFAIIGSGMSGMTLAKNLRKAGHEVHVFEKEANPGGIARGFKKEEWKDSVELFYHHFFQKDKSLLRLIDELGYRDQVTFRSPKTVMYHKGKFYRFDTIPAAVLYPGLGYGIHKLRFGLVGIYLRLTKNYQKLEQFTAKEWMTRYAGEFAYKTMWEPMMIGKFGEKYADQVSMAWLWARIYSRTTSLGTFEGGLQRLFDLFAEFLREKGVRFHFLQTLKQIVPQESGYELQFADGGSQHFDQVVVTTSPSSMLSLCPSLPQAYQQQLAELKHIGAVVVCLSLKKPLSPEGYYWYNLPKNEGYPFLALVEHTNFVPSERYNGETIIYAGDYLEPDHPYFNMSESELVEKLIPGFKRINPAFDASWILSVKKFASDYAQPVPFINQSKRIPSMRTPLKGLYFVSMSQVYPWDRGLNFAVEWADKLSSEILS